VLQRHKQNRAKIFQ